MTDIKRILYSTIFLLPSLGAFGHGNLIRGTVADAQTGERLTGASVVLNEDQHITRTDSFGNFVFDNLPDGTYTLRITFVGYQTYLQKIAVAHNATEILSIQLLPSPLQLNEVTVSDSHEPDRIMSTISRVDLELRPMKSSQDVLRLIPGLVTAQHAGGGKAEQIFLRGFDIDHGTDIALSVDGMPVNMVSHAHGQGYADLHFVIPELIDHVDFNKGPYYARIGDFNTAGYADFHTRRSLESSSVTFEAGRFDTWRTLALIDLLGDQVRNQHAYAAAEYLFTNGPFVSPQNFTRLNLFGKYHGLIAEDKLVELSLSTFRSDWDASGQIPVRAVRNGMIGRFGAIDDSEGGHTGRTNLNMAMTKILQNGGSFRNQIYLSQYDFDLYSNFTFFLNDRVRGDGIRQKESRTIYGYRGTYQRDLVLGSTSVMTESGVSLRYDDIKGNELSRVQRRHTFLGPISFGDVSQINASAYTEASIKVTPRLNVTAGLRLDAFSFQYKNRLDSLYSRQTASRTIGSPKLNASYAFSKNLQLYIKNGLGFHSNDSRVAVTQQAVETLPRAYGTDIGIFAKPIPNILVNIAVWQLRLEQEFVYVGDESVVELSGETQRYGLDLSVRYQLSDWLFLDFDGNYAHGTSVADPEGENYIPLAPRFTSIGGLTANLRRGVSAGVRYRYIGDRPANEDNTVQAEGYFLLDAGLTWTTDKIRLGLHATNLLNIEWNEAQFDTETRLPGEAESVSELTFTPGDPRFIKAGITFFF